MSTSKKPQPATYAGVFGIHRADGTADMFAVSGFQGWDAFCVEVHRRLFEAERNGHTVVGFNGMAVEHNRCHPIQYLSTELEEFSERGREILRTAQFRR
jgi:hypothetical protein